VLITRTDILRDLYEGLNGLRRLGVQRALASLLRKDPNEAREVVVLKRSADFSEGDLAQWFSLDAAARRCWDEVLGTVPDTTLAIRHSIPGL